MFDLAPRERGLQVLHDFRRSLAQKVSSASRAFFDSISFARRSISFLNRAISASLSTRRRTRSAGRIARSNEPLLPSASRCPARNPQARKIRQPQDRIEILFDQSRSEGDVAGKIGSHLSLRIEFHLRANIARRHHDFLNQRHRRRRRRRPSTRSRRVREPIAARWTCSLPLRQPMPQFFGQKRHHRMQQPQRRLEHRKNIAPRRQRNFAIRVSELRLHPLDVPIAEIAPEKLIDRLASLVKTEILERIVHFACHRRKPRKNPAMRQRAFALHRIRRRCANFRRRQFLQSKTRRASTFSRFTNKNRAAFQILFANARAPKNAILAQRDVRARRGHARQHVAQRVGAVLLRQFAAGPRPCPWSWTSLRLPPCAPANADKAAGREFAQLPV